jgi:hypothetical protein
MHVHDQRWTGDTRRQMQIQRQRVTTDGGIVPSVPIAALLIGHHLAGFKKAGIVMGPGATPPERVPPGVIALGGYANRLLVLCDVGWLMLIAWVYLSVR